MTTLELLKQYLTDYFINHTPEKILSYLSDDLHCYGFADEKEIENLEQGKAMLNSGLYEKFMEYKIQILESKEITDESAMLVYSLTHNEITVRYRLVGTSVLTDSGRKLNMLNFCMINPKQTLNMYNEMAQERQNEAIHDVLDSSIPGGIIGVYNEEKFPFYYINQRMLDYLGYESEEDFLSDTEGYITNIIHPDEQKKVEEQIFAQLSQKNEYWVEYRIRKSDGSYIWMHDMGKVIKNNEGREVIISACYDITGEKEHQLFVDSLMQSLNGNLATYMVDEVGKRTIPLFLSDAIGGEQGLTKEEYMEKYNSNAMTSIYPQDRERVWNSMCKTLHDDSSASVSFRLMSDKNNIEWVNATYARYGENNGLPVVRVMFSPVSIEYDLQLQALSQESTGICVIDTRTREVYFANDAVYKILGKECSVKVGRKCFELFNGCSGDCERCKQNEEIHFESLDKIVHINDRYISVHSEIHDWNDRQVMVSYVNDVTARQLLEQELRQEEEILQKSCDFAGIWSWVYDIPNKRAKCGKKIQEQFKISQWLPDYPESFLASEFILDRYKDLYRQKVDAVRNGSKAEEFEVQICVKEQVVHWCRISFNRLEENPDLAICIAQLIDDEKILQARLDLERQKMLGSNNSLVSYSVANVTNDVVVERYSAQNDERQTGVGITIEEEIADIKSEIYPEDWEEYSSKHTREYLLNSFENGTTEFSFVGRSFMENGGLKWLRGVFNLLKEPQSGDIY